MIYVIIKCPCHEEGASKLIDWAKVTMDFQ